MGKENFSLFGPGDQVKVDITIKASGHCGHQYAFEGGFRCVLSPEQIYTIVLSRTKNGKKQYSVNAPDDEGVTRMIWLDESDLVPAVIA